ncbi:MAG TPA: malto-oligosyltrehalose synthase [Syntrophorhabdaceae bacterium]|nr:malto-oligosyltrehalose synthase [Syntrophorhabdaceae bacterium]
MERPVFRNLRIPLATYRVQFNRDFRFTDAVKVIPYLRELGITDLYASPYFAARPGSLHGYDITDPTRINPEIGTREDYDIFVTTLREHDMGQILDIVPNHMCIDGENRYWMDLLENGPSSPYSGFFDIDWDPVKEELHGKILLPFLGDQYGVVLEDRQIRLEYRDGSFFVLLYEIRLPLLPETYSDILSFGIDHLGERIGETAGYEELLSIITSAGKLPSYVETDPERAAERTREKEIVKKRLNGLYRSDGDIRAFVDRNIAVFNGNEGDPKSFDLLDGLLSRQIYRLSHWQVATEEINYRRFFDINSLAAIRVEDPTVFDETHRFVFELIEGGCVTGLRVDHPDGLYDPSEYFDRLQRRCFAIAMRSHLEEVRENVDLPYGRSYIEPAISERYDEALRTHRYFKPFYIVAEKILGKGEIMPEEWPLFSTTGYVFLNSLNGLFVDGRNAKAFDTLYRRFTGMQTDFQDVLYENKKLVMEVAMSSEVNTLGRSLNRITEMDRQTRDFTLNSLIKVIIEVIACFPVYRTYINGPDVKERDRHYIELALSRAIRKNPALNESIFLFMKRVLLLEFSADMDEEMRGTWLNFAMKFQQTTGPVMAKGVEDTAFYVYNRLVSLNEVGGSPDRFGTSPDTFHGQNIERIKNWPYALITSSTHDTKRSEDVRARINVLSEIPGEWREHVVLWAKVNRKRKMLVNNRKVPDSNEEYLLYQTLVGSWPFGTVSDDEYESYKGRIKAYMAKAAKEAKVNTSWINPDRMYEEAMTLFVDSILDRRRDNPFLADFVPFQQRVSLFGMYNSAAQTLLKICSPGVPDFYQGTEVWNLSLVDPDNRMPVDHGLRMRMLDEMKEQLSRRDTAAYAKDLTSSMEDGRIKLYITYKALGLRRKMREVFEKGEYIPLEAAGTRSEHVIAFARRFLNTMIIVVVPRFVAKVLSSPGMTFEDMWEDTMVIVPESSEGATFRNVLTGEELARTRRQGLSGLACSGLFRNLPVALLETGR